MERSGSEPVEGEVATVCILLVEDETLIRSIMRESLEEAGFEVFDVGTAAAALDAIETRARPFSILVTDLHLAGSVDGLAIARSMRTHFPAVPVVVATGRPDVLGEEGVPFTLLAKPYGVSDLVRTVTRLRS